MGMSCNGCRVLRKGCSENCTIKHCLHWIESSESQANATLFLAKFYGRSGLINLLEASPHHLRPATFRSLLYEACGRIVSPVHGSAGLLWSGNWAQCQAAVDAVLSGSPLSTQLSLPARIQHGPYEIRHLSQGPTNNPNSTFMNRPGFNHPVQPPRTLNNGIIRSNLLTVCNDRFPNQIGGLDPAPARASSSASLMGNNTSSHKEGRERLISLETAERSLLKRTEPEPDPDQMGEFALDLTLGLSPAK